MDKVLTERLVVVIGAATMVVLLFVIFTDTQVPEKGCFFLMEFNFLRIKQESIYISILQELCNHRNTYSLFISCIPRF